MPKILSAKIKEDLPSATQGKSPLNIAGKVFAIWNSLDGFTRLTFATFLLFLLVTPALISGYVLYNSFADTLPVVSSTVTVDWGDSTGIVSWTPMPNAAQYKVSLIRVADNALMQQFTLPAVQIKGDHGNVLQLKADAQGIWPGKMYQVAVQELDISGNALAQPVVSAPGQSVPLNTSLYNGFLDRMGYGAGPINHNLWFQSDYNDVSTQGTFINGQIHGHMEVGQIAIEQSFIGQRARIPVDFTGRTATIRGEVDFHSDQPNWMGIVLTPNATHPGNMTDDDDRLNTPTTSPEVELLDGIHSGFRLIYVKGDGSSPIDLPAVPGISTIVDEIPNPTDLVNVRDNVEIQLSTTHIKITINGKTYYDTNFPSPLSFSKAYLMLGAEFYPKIATDGNVENPCDQPGGKCNVWHLDNWGFDAPQGQVMPQVEAFYQDGCAPEPAGVMPVNECGRIFFGYPDVVGSIHSQNVNVTEDPANITHAGVAFSTYNWVEKNVARVRVNGGAWHSLAGYPSAGGIYGAQSFMIDVVSSDIHKGANLVEWQLQDSINTLPQIYNTQLEIITNKPYVEPSLPSEPAPIGTWGGGVSTSTLTPTSGPLTPTVGPSTVPNSTPGSWVNISPAGVSTDFNNPPSNYGFQTVVADPNHPGTLYVGTNYQGIYKSTNSGASWGRIDKPGVNGITLDGRNWCLSMDYFNSNIMYACNGYGGNQGVFKSTDGGVTWNNMLTQANFSNQTADVYDITTDPLLTNHILVSFHSPWGSNPSGDAGILESKDGGATWILHNPQSGWGAGHYIFFMGNSNTWLLGTQGDGFWKTTDSGATWTQVSTQNMMHGAGQLYHASNGAWYVGALNTLLRSTNNGDSWTQVGVSNQDGYNAVIGDGTTLYAQSANTGSNTTGLNHYITSPESDGTNWTQMNNQTFTDGPMSMSYDSVNKIVYSSNWAGGVWRLSLSTSTPTPTNASGSPTSTPSLTPTSAPLPTPTLKPTSTPTPKPTPTLAPNATPTSSPTSSGILGFNSIGSIKDDGDANYMNGTKFTMGTTGGNATSMSVYIANIQSSPNNQYQMAIYTDRNGKPGTLVAKTSSGTLHATSWNTLSITASLNANTPYWLMYNTNASLVNANNMLYNNALSSIGAYGKQRFGNWPSVFPGSAIGPWKFSIYVSYH